MRIDWWTLALQTVNVVVLIWLLSRFLYRPVLDAVSARQAAADALLSEANAAKARGEADAQAIEAKRRALAEGEESLKAKAVAEAEAMRKVLLEHARKDAAEARAKAEAGLAAERCAARADLEVQAGKLALQIAAKLLGRLPPGVACEPLFDQLVERVAALPEAERQRLGDSDGQLELVSADPVDEAAADRWRAALERALGHPARLTVWSDPDLVAGFELVAPHTRVTNSWRSDLQQVARALEEPAGQGNSGAV